jgi:hypothetical protein
MNEMSWKEAVKEVRGSIFSEIYEKRGGGWFKYTRAIGSNIDVEEVDKSDVPSKVKTMRRVTGCDIIYTRMYEVRPVTKGCPRSERVVVEHRYGSSDAAAVGEAVGGLLRGLFR